MPLFKASSRSSGTGKMVPYYRTGPLGLNLPTLPILSNLNSWFRSTSGITKDGNDRVSAWADQSGNGNHMAQGTGAYQPVWVSNSLNGRPIIRFGTTAASALGTSGYSLNSNHTMYMVFRNITWNANWAIAEFGANSRLWHNGAFASPEINWTDTTTAETRNTDQANNTWAIVTMKMTLATTKSYQVNKNTATTAVQGSGGGLGSYYFGGTTNQKQFDLAEFLIYSEVHDTNTTNAMIDYLNSNYQVF